MTLEEILAKLEDDTAKAELKKLIEKKDADLAKAKENVAKAKEATKQATSNNKGVADKLEKVLEAFGIDGDDDEFEESLASALKAKTTDASMQRKLAKMQKKLEDAAAKYESDLKAERSKRFEGVKRQKLLDALNENNANEANLLVDMLIGKIDFDEDDESISSGGNDVGDMIKSFLKEHPVFLKNKQTAGAGSNLGSNGGNPNEDEDVAFVKNLGNNAKAREQNDKVLESYFN